MAAKISMAETGGSWLWRKAGAARNEKRSAWRHHQPMAIISYENNRRNRRHHRWRRKPGGENRRNESGNMSMKIIS
jgi:hypothetical protein